MKIQTSKNVFIGILMLISLASTSISNAQKPPKKAELRFTVSGNCGMCEKRIETALDVKGVNFADWDRETKEILIKYNPRVITEEEVHKKIAAVGHDTPKVKADTTVYVKLPGCCLYRENPNTHND